MEQHRFELSWSIYMEDFSRANTILLHGQSFVKSADAEEPRINLNNKREKILFP